MSVSITNKIDNIEMTKEISTFVNDFLSCDAIKYTISFNKSPIITFIELTSDNAICSLNYNSKIMHIINEELFYAYFNEKIIGINNDLLKKAIFEIIDTLKVMKLIKNISIKSISDYVAMGNFNTTIKSIYNDKWLYSNLFGFSYPKNKLFIAKTLILKDNILINKYSFNFYNKITFTLESDSNENEMNYKLTLLKASNGKKSFPIMKYTGKMSAGMLLNYYIMNELKALGVETNINDVFNENTLNIYEMIGL